MLTDTITHRLILDNGTNLATCTESCRTKLAGVLYARRVPATASDTPVRQRASCAHCAWCGRVVQVVAHCLWHDGPGGDCPTFDWTVTECGRRAVTVLAQLCPNGLTERAWEELNRQAWALHRGMAGFPNVGALTQAMMDRRLDWLPVR